MISVLIINLDTELYLYLITYGVELKPPLITSQHMLPILVILIFGKIFLKKKKMLMVLGIGFISDIL